MISDNSRLLLLAVKLRLGLEKVLERNVEVIYASLVVMG